MAKRKSRLILLIIGGIVLFAIGYLLAQKYQTENFTQAIFNFSQTLDSDKDSLLDSQEKELGTNPYLADTDGDSFDDKTEIDTKHDPNKIENNDLIDKDNDGLIGKDENKYGTDPNIADTDFDGYKDGEEIASGHDPKTADLSNLKDTLAQIPEDQKNNSNLLTADSLNALEGALSSDQADQIKQYADQLLANTNKDLELKEILDSDIKILDQEANQQNVQEYLNQLMSIIYFNLDFIFDKNKSEQLINDGDYQKSANYIANAYLKSADQIKQINAPNNDEIKTLHKDAISIFSSINQNYQILNNNSSNAADITQALKNILTLNKLIQEKVLDQISNIAEEYNLEKFYLNQ